eukprot:Plantae.Rhodophyta-Hildenbrandia_rubra.ctg27639.p1 GENE.Plantae.Rhodophyta-Hildenbrandia_rubra.ctg27639~~Plantae.Rhodophyta-Hildenbrandia_rubra.ctg27639.p1  ORF type:complete len:154 (+),score=37.54 Plantae.Rhodophyta-Hildenbrandia_rubra.ctg27639:197-658(+)
MARDAKVVGNNNVERTEVRNSMHRRLDGIVTRISDSYQDVIKATKIENEMSSSMRGIMTIEVEAANIVSSCEALLRLVSELKVVSVAQDVKGVVGDVREMRERFDRDNGKVVGEWIGLRDKVGECLVELEKHYYQSIAHYSQHVDKKNGNEGG